MMADISYRSSKLILYCTMGVPSKYPKKWVRWSKFTVLSRFCFTFTKTFEFQWMWIKFFFDSLNSLFHTHDIWLIEEVTLNEYTLTISIQMWVMQHISMFFPKVIFRGLQVSVYVFDVWISLIIRFTCMYVATRTLTNTSFFAIILTLLTYVLHYAIENLMRRSIIQPSSSNSSCFWLHFHGSIRIRNPWFEQFLELMHPLHRCTI